MDTNHQAKPYITKNVTTERAAQLRVVFVCCDNTLSTSISLPMELLQAAEAIGATRLNRGARTKLSMKLASLDGKPILTHTGTEIVPHCRLDDLEHADIIFLPALWRNPIKVVQKNKKICEWLTKMFSRETTVIAGVGTGCCFMAEAGLLDNRFATTHWYFFEEFKKRYPKVKLQQKYFITQSERLYCTGSVNTLADLTVHFISQLYTPEISAEVERHFFHDLRGGYEKLALLENPSRPHPDEDILEVQTFLAANFSEKIDFQKLAVLRNMSRRNFDRRFKQALGLTPLSYLQQLRMQHAKELLKNSNLSVSEIMFKTGYHDAAHFGSLFKQYYKATPRQYRTTVRAKLFQQSE